MPLPTIAARSGSLPRRLLSFVAAAAIILVALVQHPDAAEAANCQFTLGFATLHNLIPTVVGNCVADETHNPTNGDGLQSTTRGLLVWRKADNFTAFTNGHQTWVNGPFGLQVRLNTARFGWEPDAAPPDVDPRLSVAYRIANGSQFANLIGDVVAEKIPVRLVDLPAGVYGAFSVDSQAGRPLIQVAQSLADADPNDAAAVLIHESTHAFDFSHQPDFETSRGCLQTELHAKSNDLTFWRHQFGPTGKQPAVNLFEKGENAVLALAETDLRALLVATFNTYRSECGL